MHVDLYREPMEKPSIPDRPKRRGPRDVKGPHQSEGDANPATPLIPERPKTGINMTPPIPGGPIREVEGEQAPTIPNRPFATRTPSTSSTPPIPNRPMRVPHIPDRPKKDDAEDLGVKEAQCDVVSESRLGEGQDDVIEGDLEDDHPQESSRVNSLSGKEEKPTEIKAAKLEEQPLPESGQSSIHTFDEADPVENDLSPSFANANDWDTEIPERTDKTVNSAPNAGDSFVETSPGQTGLPKELPLTIQDEEQPELDKQSLAEGPIEHADVIEEKAQNDSTEYASVEKADDFNDSVRPGGREKAEEPKEFEYPENLEGPDAHKQLEGAEGTKHNEEREGPREPEELEEPEKTEEPDTTEKLDKSQSPNEFELSDKSEGLENHRELSNPEDCSPQDLSNEKTPHYNHLEEAEKAIVPTRPEEILTDKSGDVPRPDEEAPLHPDFSESPGADLGIETTPFTKTAEEVGKSQQENEPTPVTKRSTFTEGVPALKTAGIKKSSTTPLVLSGHPHQETSLNPTVDHSVSEKRKPPPAKPKKPSSKIAAFQQMLQQQQEEQHKNFVPARPRKTFSFKKESGEGEQKGDTSFFNDLNGVFGAHRPESRPPAEATSTQSDHHAGQDIRKTRAKKPRAQRRNLPSSVSEPVTKKESLSVFTADVWELKAFRVPEKDGESKKELLGESVDDVSQHYHKPAPESEEENEEAKSQATDSGSGQKGSAECDKESGVNQCETNGEGEENDEILKGDDSDESTELEQSEEISSQ